MEIAGSGVRIPHNPLMREYSSLIMLSIQFLEHRKFLDFLRPKSTRLLRKLFLDLCDEYKVQNLLEIGAHEASISCDFLKLNSSINRRALAFEANPFTYKEITKQSLGCGVELYNLGISSTVGNLEFNIPVRVGTGNLTPGNASFLTRTDDLTNYHKLNVATDTIDHVFDSRSVLGTSAFWIDVEGFAHEVLKGATLTLNTNQVVFLQIEVEAIKYWRGQKTHEIIFANLSDLGYFPIARDFEYQYQYNVLFCKGNMITTSKTLVKLYNRRIRILVIINLIVMPYFIIQKMLAKFFK
jgi:FkbM family methyltransferase